MPFPNIFKKKKKETAPKEDITKKTEGKKTKKTAVSEKKKTKGKTMYFGVLKSPYITEKAIDLTSENKYTFKVFPRANKTEIKKAVESLYNVDVLKVSIIKVPSKRRGSRMTSGWKRGFKKAIVKIKEGQRIEDFYH